MTTRTAARRRPWPRRRPGRRSRTRRRCCWLERTWVPPSVSDVVMTEPCTGPATAPCRCFLAGFQVLAMRPVGPGSAREADPPDEGVRDIHVEVTVGPVGRGLAGIHRGPDPVQPEGPRTVPQA